MSEQETVSAFYDAFALAQSRAGDATDRRAEGRYLTFGLLAKPDRHFAWPLGLVAPRKYPEHAQRVLEAQQALRAILFASVDFSGAAEVLDFGCGYGSDLVDVAIRHADARLDGFTLSPKQADLANRRVRARGLADRVRIHCRDSARDPFPGLYDLAFGLEVIGLVKDKAALFANLAGHLKPGGLVLLCDFIARTSSSIEIPESSTFTPTGPTLADLLAAHQLRILECIDASREVANFLDDPRGTEHLVLVAADLDLGALTRRQLASFPNIGAALRRGLLSYRLLTAQKDPNSHPEALIRANRDHLEVPTPCARVWHRARPAGRALGPPGQRGTTTAEQLFVDLARQGVRLWADGDRLRYRAPAGALTAEMRTALAEHKPELLLLLQPAGGTMGD